MKQFFIKIINLFLSIFMRRRMLLNSGGGVEDQVIEPMSVVFVNKEDNSLTIAGPDKWDTTLFPPSKFEPIGIVVIPNYHGVLKDGTGTKNQCGVISLATMNCNTPETGSHDRFNQQLIYWGDYENDISEKSDGIGRYDSTTNGLTNYNDNIYIDIQQSIGGIPSWGNINPYKDTDNGLSNERNTNYGVSGVLSDFSGIVNTKIITDQITVNNWKTSTIISNSSSTGNYPAAQTCARFKTTGTKAFVDCTIEELRNGTGFWYLPAVGELGYINPRIFDFNDIIDKLNTNYGVGAPLWTGAGYWSSSENGIDRVYYVSTTWGLVDHGGKYNSERVRAFMRL